MTSPKPSWKSVKKKLAAKAPGDLLSLIRGLYRLDDRNRQYICARLTSTDEVLEGYRLRVKKAMRPDVFGDQEVSISAARRAITEYRSATDDDDGVLDLMVSFVEYGNGYTLDYGDMWEGFYDSLVSMFRRVARNLPATDSGSRFEILGRLESVVNSSRGMGWGYHDALVDLYEDACQSVNRE